MSSKLTSDSLIESVKRRASVPESQSTYTAEDILAFADEELNLALVPEILTLHEDYLLFEDVVPLVGGQQAYRVPERAIGSKLRDVQVQSQDGSTLGEMTRIGIGDRFNDFDRRGGQYLKQFYMKNSKVVLLGEVEPTPTESLLMIYYISPSKLVTDENIGVIKGISAPASGQVTLTLQNFPDDFTALNELGAPQKYDLYTSYSPNNILKKDIEITSLDNSSSSITISETDLPSDLQIGDHLSLAGQSAIPQIPSDLHPMLAQLVACRLLESMGDTQGLQNALIKLGQMQKAAGILIDNRVEDAPRKLVNRHSLLKTGIFSGWFGRKS